MKKNLMKRQICIATMDLCLFLLCSNKTEKAFTPIGCEINKNNNKNYRLMRLPAAAHSLKTTNKPQKKLLKPIVEGLVLRAGR